MKNKITYCFALSFFFFLSAGLKAQQGKDGPGNITVANTTVNIYTPLTVSVTANTTNIITVGSATGFSAGDLIYIIQNQGATVNAYTNQYGNPNQTVPNDTSEGKIKSYNSTGNNEFAEVTSVSGNNLTLDCVVKNTYGDSSGGVPKVQVIRVPRYTTLTLTSPGTITCPAWNGSTGGIVVIEVQGATTIGTGSSIDVSAKGFRGGLVFNATGYGATNAGSNYASPPSDNPGAHKGESIVGDTNVYKRQNMGNYNIGLAFWLSCPLSEGKGNVANGGGGGNSMNCGGGGGSNGGVVASWNGMGNPDNSTANNISSWNQEPAGSVNGTFRPTSSSGGGRGGYSFSGSNQDPTTTGPNLTAWTGDNRHNDGGWGGIPLDYSTGRLFLGGGGGAGDSNDKSGTSGGNGGGMVYLVTYGNISGAGQILADGGTAANTNTVGGATQHGDDGAGGGGGGGTVIIKSSGSISLTNATPISAKGGNGGSMVAKLGITLNSNFGPGGGGGGGYVATTSAVTGINVAGGANGIVVQNTYNGTKIATKFPPNGATSGGAGSSTTATNFYLTASNYTICAGSSASLSVTANGTGIPSPISYDWYNSSVGGTPVFTGNPYNTGALSVGTYTYYAGTCPGTYRIPVVVTVLNAPTLTVTANPASICVGQTSTLTANGASSYTWSPSTGLSATSGSVVIASPVASQTYTVIGANGTCTDTKTVSVNITATPTVTAVASATTICSGTVVTFTASGATNYTWSANAGSVTTATATATPASSATFTVNGDNGGCQGTFTLAVNVIATPTVTAVASPTTICSSGSSTLTASGATTFTWSANANSATTATTVVTPGATDTYTVTGDNGGGCTATKTVAVNVVTTPTVVINPSPAAICSGASVTFTATGASNYTWSANAGSVTTATANVSPTVNTTYTVTGDNGGGCVSTQTVDVTITPTPNLNAVASSTAICNGSSITLTATGATSYTWSANAGSVNTATATATPTITSIYTVTGDSLGCPATKTVSVVVNNPPTQADSVAVSAACGQSNGSYQINSVTGGTGPYQINFNNTGFTAIGSFTYTVPNLAAGNYPVVIQDNAGCTYSTSVIINNAGGITAVDSSITNASCNPSNSGAITLNSVTGGTAPYQVSVNGGSFSSIGSFPYNISGLTAGTYTLNVKDASGCMHITQITVAPPAGGITSVTANSQNAMCVPPTSGSISINTITGGTGPYQVSVNGGTYSSISSLPYSIPGLVANTYTLDVQDALGCINSSTITVGGSSGPTNALVTTVKDTCGKNVGSLTITSVVGGTPTYSYNINGGTNQTSNTFTALPTGYYTVTVTDANGCMFVHYDSVRNVLPPPVPVITGPNAVCTGASATLTSSSASGNTWSTSATTQTISVNTSGTYTVSVTQNGCVSTSAPFTFTVNPNPTLVVSPSTTICAGGSTTLAASGGSTYTWTPATGLSSTSNGTVTANPSVPTTYTVSTTDANNCSATGTVDIAVGVMPGQPGITDSTLYYCLYQSGIPNLTATATGGATLNWYDSNMNPIVPGPPRPDSSKLAPQVYYVTQSIGSCTSAGKDSIKVYVMAPPSASFTTSPVSGEILANQGVTFIPVQAANPSLMYSWNFGDPNSGTDDISGLYSPTHTYADAGTYCVTFDIMSMVSGCESVITNCIEVLPGINITIPNVFTPNGDGINEVFVIKSTGFSDLSCSIFDRWGLKLYSWTGIAGSWDGTDSKNGKAVTDGTYYYIIEATDVKKEKHKYEGYIQLIR
ncbi:MAG: T9SS type B sorting domain-containing protein [Bacteroidia bacterium]